MTVLMLRNPAFLEEIESLTDFAEPFDYELYVPVDAFVEKDQLIMKMELPGVKEEDIDVSLEDNTLNIKAEKKAEKLSEDVTYYESGRWFGRYFRSFELPFRVDVDKIVTHFEDGVLEVRLPRSEETKPRHIDITGTKKTIESGIEPEAVVSEMESAQCIGPGCESEWY